MKIQKKPPMLMGGFLLEWFFLDVADKGDYDALNDDIH